MHVFLIICSQRYNMPYGIPCHIKTNRSGLQPPAEF